MGATRYAAARVRGWGATGAGELRLELEDANAEVSIAEDGSVRLRACTGEKLERPLDPGIGRAPWQPTRTEPRERDGSLWLAHDGRQGTVQVEIRPDPFALRVRARNGESVAELEDLGFAEQGAARIGYRARSGERFLGFGETDGGLDKRGRRLLLRNRDPELSRRGPRYLSIPFFLGFLAEAGASSARGLLLDAFGASRFDVAATHPDRVVIETEADGIDLTIFPGPAPADVLRRFTARVGRTPLPPLWALGHHQSRWSYASEEEVLALAREIRRRRIPTDVIHLDIDYMRGFRVFTWDPRRFPDPKQLVADLSALGFRLVTIVDPGVKRDDAWPVYRDGAQWDDYCRRPDGELFSLRVWPGESVLPDFNREDVRSWWGEQHRPLLDIGVAGIWNDMNEPAGWKRDVRIGRWMLPLQRQDVSSLVQSHPLEPDRRVPHDRVRNLYGLQECRATRGFLECADPEKRPFVLTRSGSAGIQRFAAVWTGDNRSRWSDLRESIPMLLNLSLSGVAFCGADIGGFLFSCSPELYARWIQIGALYPFARTHSMWLKRRQEPWSFGPRVEAIAQRFLELRMRLLPYLYALFREAEENGAPIWRPLLYEFPGDPESAAVEDQVMLGPSLLAAPVLERGARERELHLPPGRWIAWDDDAQYVGPRRLRVHAPLERLPLFLRAGSILPTQSAIRSVAEAPAEPCILEVVPGADGVGTLLADDGETTAYRSGRVARSELRLWHRAGGRLRLEIGRREGDYAVPPRTLRVSLRCCPAPERVTLDGRRLARRDDAPGYGCEAGRLQVRFEDGGESHVLEVDPAP